MTFNSTTPHERNGASERTTVRRHPERGVYDREVIHQIVDEALICHVGIVDEQRQPFVMPVIHTRVDDHLYIHGSRGSRLLRRIAEGAPVCVTMTIIDGLVLARSAFHHSMNYRSVVVLGRGSEVVERQLKAQVFDALVEHVVRGRLNDVRRPSESEIDATMLVSIPLAETSAKIRSGPPMDDDKDMSLPHWAGLIPLSLHAGEPIPAQDLDRNVVTPAYAINYARR